MGYLACGCKGKCRCNDTRDIVYPTRKEVKNTYSEETINHIHPSHTTVINHHTIRNVHFYPHTTSYEERVREIDVRGAEDGWNNGRNDVGGVGEQGRPACNDVRGDYDKGCGKGSCHSHCSCRRKRSWW